ncbi:hypothetical protein BHP03_001752 [Shigella sonnei]|nr:hypothetical protein [Shigella sonnei]
MVDTTQTTTEKKLTQSDIRGVFLRSNLFQGSWNFERMQALGFCFSMVPAIRRLYPENNEARKQAIRRHLEFFNTQPFVAAPILGVTSKGIDIVKDMGGGFLQKLTEGASILGLFVMGALVNKWTHVNIPLVVSRITDQTGKEHVTTVQTILDQLMPGLVPLLLTFACMWLLRKKVNPLWIIVGFFVIGIAGYACGLLGL